MSTHHPGATGWPAEGPALLAAIAADNTREFWLANRMRFDELVLAPMRGLAAALYPEFGAMRVFRPQVNRRFKPDAPLYRTDTGGVATTAGGCALGVVLSARALSVSAGHWAFDTGQLRRYRAAVDGEPGAELERLLGELDGCGVHRGRALSGAPRNCPPDHPRIALLRFRGLQVTRTWELGQWLESDEPLQRITDAWRAALPVVGWLDEHVGPADPVIARPRVRAETGSIQPGSIQPGPIQPGSIQPGSAQTRSEVTEESTSDTSLSA